MRLRLLEIAEHLFAELGVENTPLQRIVAESGQRNRSALNYHFGSRRDLLSALLDMRTRYMNGLRHDELDKVAAAGEEANIALIARAVFQPLVDVIEHEPWGHSYVQVLAQSLFDPGLTAHELISAETTSGMRRGRDMLAAALPDAPRDTIDARMVWATDVVIYSLARWCREGAGVGTIPGQLEDMYDFIIHGMSAPVSLQTRRGQPPGSDRKTGLARWLDAGLDDKT